MPKTDEAPTGVWSFEFATQGLCEAEQFDAWREQLGPQFGIADVSRPRLGSFHARMEMCVVGKLGISDITADAMTFERKRVHVERRDRDEFTIGLLLEGSGTIEQEGRETRIGKDDLVLCDNRRPFRVHFDRPFRQLVFHCDRAQLQARMPDAEQRTAMAVKAGSRVVHAAAEYLGALGKDPGAAGAPAVVAAQHALDVLALVVGQNAPSGDAAGRSLLKRIEAYVEDHLGDSALSPGSIARHHRVSRRHLYRLFDEGGEGVAAFIRRRRLVRARVLLADQGQERRSIAEIGFACGFNDASSFARVFRDMFGIAPSEFRAQITPPPRVSPR